ncbi:sulfurtransferase [Salipaludibacillus daqingensis]|uniref:sulfurtransferase n=1 Tax=Salipaludibacillus daqingensis TaxID=3041001 RepID=UPI003CC87B85
MTKNIVEADWLEKQQLADVVIFDCRFHLDDSNKGYEEYLVSHIPGAVYLDLEKDLSGEVQIHGGRHPLPDIDDFIEKLRKSGVSKDSTVVAYDDQRGAMASRLWWMLNYVGHDNVYVLNGGFQYWVEKGYSTSSRIPLPNRSNFKYDLQTHLIASKSEVKDSIGDDAVVLIDSRAKERYEGKVEPIDTVAGHIPGAFQENWQDRTTDVGLWKNQTELRKELNNYLESSKEIIVYCGSGVTACVNVLALTELGVKPKLYIGSWSDWISYKDTPIITK